MFQSKKMLPISAVSGINYDFFLLKALNGLYVTLVSLFNHAVAVIE